MAFIPTALLKKHLRVSGSSEDELIQSYYYPAAIGWVADYTGREITPRQVVHTATIADGGEVTLPAYPVQTVDTVLQGVTPVTHEVTDVDDNGNVIISGGSTTSIYGALTAEQTLFANVVVLDSQVITNVVQYGIITYMISASFF